MRDAWLWRCLGARERPPQLADELRALAESSAVVRAPFLGSVRELLAESDPQLRVAAIAVLAGVRGVVGLRALVAALDDDDAAVRAAAVAALRVTCREV